jgi:hypothetical protein
MAFAKVLKLYHTIPEFTPSTAPLYPPLGLFWRWGSRELVVWPQITILPFSASQVAKIPGVSHWRPAELNFITPNYISDLFSDFKYTMSI